MFRLPTVILIAFLVVFLAAPASLEAQHRGGFGTTSGAVRTSPARRSTSMIGRPVTPFVNPPVTGFGRAPVFGKSRVFPRSRGVVTVPAFIPTFGYGFGYNPYNYYSPFPGPVPVVPDPITQGYGYDYGYGQDQYAQDQAAAQNQADLTYEVGRLSQEVEDLRQQQAKLAPPPQPVAPIPVTSPVPVTPTMLVFRDGHRMEIQNYAAIGQTLWVLDQGASTKIPLSALDLEATQRENAARGIRFSVSSR